MRTPQPLLALVLLSLTFPACLQNPAPLDHPIDEFTRRGDWSTWTAKLATYNVWDLPPVAEYRAERIPLIAQALKDRDLDLAILQEAWTAPNRRILLRDSGMAEGIAFKVPRTIGSGLFTMSRSHIHRDSFREFTLNGQLWDVTEGDAYAGKGAGMITTVSQRLPISVFNTHLIARYGAGNDTFADRHTPDRMLQLFDTFRHIVEQADSDAFVITGDFNMRASQGEYALWRALTSLDGIRLEETDPAACSYCPDNSYHDSNGGQIDYVFVSPRLSLKTFTLDFRERFNGKNGQSLNLSDHYGWTATLQGLPAVNAPTPSEVRHSTALAIFEIRTWLENELSGHVEAQGIEDRVCRSCRLRDGIESLRAYEAALSDSELPTGKKGAYIRTLRMRLKSYFELFRP